MGKGNRVRSKRGADAGNGRSGLLDEVQWTPLRQECGCVIDWRWDTRRLPPHVFMQWFLGLPAVPCPWCAEGRGPAPAGATRQASDPDSGASFHARTAAGDDIALGQRLAAELLDLTELVTSNKADALLEQIPEGYRTWLAANGYDPVDAWLDQKLTDIILNHGSTQTGELLANLPPRVADDQHAATCPICAFSRAEGGILCVCGHDWSCHPTAAAGEPCSHCACQDMRAPDDPPRQTPQGS